MNAQESSSTLLLTPDIPVGQLPPFLQKAISVVDSPSQKDMLLLSVLTAVSAVLPHIRLLYGKPALNYYTNLMTLIIAPAASGKGVMNNALKLIQPIEDQLSMFGRTVQIPTNSSTGAFMDQLEANDNAGFIFDTEIDELSKTWKQNFSNYSTILRKAAQHESHRMTRKLVPYEQISTSVKEPHLSVLLSGTPNQLKPLLGTGEDGLASRFIPYFLGESPAFDMGVYVSDERENETLQNPVYEQLADELFARWKWLFKQDRDCFWKVSKEQWDELGSYFAEHHALSEFFSVNEAGYRAMVNRMSANFQRIGAILAALRLDITKPFPERIDCCDDDFQTLLSLADKLIYHGGQLVDELNTTKNAPMGKLPKPSKSEMLFDMLPSSFTYSYAMQIGKTLGFSEPSTYRYLNNLQQNGLVELVGRNNYQKLR